MEAGEKLKWVTKLDMHKKSMFISVQMHQNLREVLITKDKLLQVLHNDLLGIHMYGEEQT